MITEKIRKSQFDLEVTYIHNPIYSQTNTVYSLWLARSEMDTDFIFANGDVFFHVDVLKRLLKSKHGSCLAIDRKKVGEEEIKVKIENGLVTEIGKKIEPSRADGEFVGVAKFGNEINDSFKRRLEEVVEEGKTKMFFEAAVQRLLSNNELYEVDVSNLPVIEIDTHTDLNEARNLVRKTRESSK
jgi:choline kinase